VKPALQVVKLGEGTYGEAFKSGQVVFKLVPMEGANLINGWPQKGAGDLLGETVIAITLSGLGEEADAAGELKCGGGVQMRGLSGKNIVASSLIVVNAVV
jgi:serine/threonine-protein kinase haspin